MRSEFEVWVYGPRSSSWRHPARSLRTHAHKQPQKNGFLNLRDEQVCRKNWRAARISEQHKQRSLLWCDYSPNASNLHQVVQIRVFFLNSVLLFLISQNFFSYWRSWSLSFHQSHMFEKKRVVFSELLKRTYQNYPSIQEQWKYSGATDEHPPVRLSLAAVSHRQETAVLSTVCMTLCNVGVVGRVQRSKFFWW